MRVITAQSGVLGKLLAAQLVMAIVEVCLNRVFIELVDEDRSKLRVFEAHGQAAAPRKEVNHSVKTGCLQILPRISFT